MAQPSLQEQIGSLVDDRLLKLLAQAFPVKIARPGDSHDKLMFEGGCAHVVEYLRECQKQARLL